MIPLKHISPALGLAATLSLTGFTTRPGLMAAFPYSNRAKKETGNTALDLMEIYSIFTDNDLGETRNRAT